MGIRMKQKGEFKKTLSFLETVAGMSLGPLMEKYGQEGVEALKAATPKDSGKTAESWIFSIDETKKGRLAINWKNTNTNEGVNVAILLQYGHIGPGDAYVEGRDYINPAIQPIINKMKQALHSYLKGVAAGAAHYLSGM